MTKEEILAMEAGVELDELVATEVMKWHKLAKGSRIGEKGYMLIDIDTWQGGDPRDVYTDMVACEEWKPSTDISAAWQVVEKLRSMEDDKGNALLCCLTIYSDHDLCWDIKWCFSELSTRDDGHQTHRLPTCYDDFPEAICKATLLIKHS